MKVFRNVNLKGVISKKRALELLGMELSVKHQIHNIDIEIYRDEMYDVFIDYADEMLSGGHFEELK